MKIIHRNPKLRAQRVAAIKKAKATAAARKHSSETMKAFFSDPENRRKRSIAMKGVKFFCRKCGREGHRKHYCPELKHSSIDRRFRCRLCGRKGHNRRTCPKSRLNSDKRAIRRQIHCKICHQSGHNRRTCTQLVWSEASSGKKAKKGFLIPGRRICTCGLCRRKGHNVRTCPNRNTEPSTFSENKQDSQNPVMQ